MPEKQPGIPPIVDDRVLAPTVRALVEIVETLVGQRVNAPPELRAVTLDQLQALERRVKALE
jgi:hypothetical protein